MNYPKITECRSRYCDDCDNEYSDCRSEKCSQWASFYCLYCPVLQVKKGKKDIYQDPKCPYSKSIKSRQEGDDQIMEKIDYDNLLFLIILSLILIIPVMIFGNYFIPILSFPHTHYFLFHLLFNISIACTFFVIGWLWGKKINERKR